MTNVLARIKVKGKDYEISVDCDRAVDFKKKGIGNIADIIVSPVVFSHLKKAIKSSEADLKDGFGTTDVFKIAERIITHGEIQLPTEYKAKAREERYNQVVEFIHKNCIDARTKLPHPAERIRAAMEQAGAKVDENKPVEQQAQAIVNLLQKIIPIKFETKRLLMRIPANFTGKAYSTLKDYIIKEEWLADGSLSCTVEMPAGAMMDILDKINSLTHGEIITQDI